MLSTYFVAADPRVVATVNFAPYGHGLYFCNATEVQKFSISAAFVKQGRRGVSALFTANTNEILPRKLIHCVRNQMFICMVSHLLVHLPGWVGLLFCWRSARLILPNSYVPKQNWSEIAMTKSKVNPTQVYEHVGHPVMEIPGCSFEIAMKN